MNELVKRHNRTMVLFDLALGSGALFAPDQTLWLLGHDKPSEDARHLFRRCGPIWLTFAAAHAVAATRGAPQDWWALTWLRATELMTDVVWSESPAVSRPGAKLGLKLAGVANLGMVVAFAAMSRSARRAPAAEVRPS